MLIYEQNCPNFLLLFFCNNIFIYIYIYIYNFILKKPEKLYIIIHNLARIFTNLVLIHDWFWFIYVFSVICCTHLSCLYEMDKLLCIVVFVWFICLYIHSLLYIYIYIFIFSKMIYCLFWNRKILTIFLLFIIPSFYRLTNIIIRLLQNFKIRNSLGKK